MLKKCTILLIMLITTLGAQAFEDCIITTDGKLTDINIENNQIVNVSPLVTIMNERDTIIIQPLQVGKTTFSVVKDAETKIVFDVEITPNETIIKNVEGFEIFQLDNPPEFLDCDLDEPPILREEDSDIEIPPSLRKGE